MRLRNVFLIMSWALMSLFSTTANADELRAPAVNGTFYPDGRKELQGLIEEYLESVSKKTVPGKSTSALACMIVPHAGYVFSGEVAAHGFHQLEGHRFETVVLMGPSHRKEFPGVSVGDYAAYRTPLGDVHVDRSLAYRLLETNGHFSFHPEAHRGEHSLEVQLPFLQTVLSDFHIVPLLFGERPSRGEKLLETCRSVAHTLVKETREKSVLFIASTDLSHYHPYDRAVRKDLDTIEGILSLDAERFTRGVVRGRFELCGGTAVSALLHIAEEIGATEKTLLCYANSGDVPLIGDHTMVVGYAAIVFRYGERSPQEAAQVHRGWLVRNDAR